jgi:hypothetical protein
MKSIKISLAVIVVAVIGFFAVKSLVNIDGTGEVGPSDNMFIKRIEQKIDSLGKLPDSKFCKEFYKEADYHINDYYKGNRFSDNQSDNKQWRDNLSKNLYSAYTGKFISQAFYVFGRDEWKVEDLQFIRSEYQTLRQSPLLQPGSDVEKTFARIQQIFSTYDEIASFISSCKGFSYSSSTLSSSFPVAEVKGKISRAQSYLKSGLGNQYVKNCIRLRAGLIEIPQSLFSAQVRYLSNKIGKWSGQYSNYNSQKEYKELLYDKLKAEIDLLYNSVYIDIGESVVDREYDQLKAKLDSDSRAAYNYFSSKTN